jgi:NAD(P)H-hydrate epimerase
MGIPYPTGKPLTCREIRELDVLAIEHVGIPGVVLMENAGRGIAEFVYDRLTDPARARVVVLCGTGNNGGDGFVVARHLHNAGVHVDVVLAAPPEKTSGDAAVNMKILQRMNFGFVRAFEAEGLEAAGEALQDADVIVDALLGTGSTGAPRKGLATLVETANAVRHAVRIAVDIPSGLDADKGVVHEPCFRADATVTMVSPKVGFQDAAARAVVGRVVPVDIGTPRALIPGMGGGKP